MTVQERMKSLSDDELLELICHDEEAVWKLARYIWNERHPEDPVGGLR